MGSKRPKKIVEEVKPVSTIRKPIKRPATLSTTPDLLRKPIA